MSSHVRPEEFWHYAMLPARVAAALRRPVARVVPVDPTHLARRAAHYRALDAEGRSGRFHGATRSDRAEDWALRTAPDMMLFASGSPGGVPAGLAEIHLGGAGHGELALSVLPEWRGRGLGRALIDAAVEAARAAGLAELEVDYSAGNTALAHLMLEHGARISHEAADRIALLELSVAQDGPRPLAGLDG